VITNNYIKNIYIKNIIFLTINFSINSCRRPRLNVIGMVDEYECCIVLSLLSWVRSGGGANHNFHKNLDCFFFVILYLTVKIF